jgi:hypothetical protein
LLEVDEGSKTLDLDARASEVLDQKPLVLILRVDENVGEGAEPAADVA